MRHLNMHKHLPEPNFAITLPVAVCFVMILANLCFYRQLHQQGLAKFDIVGKQIVLKVSRFIFVSLTF